MFKNLHNDERGQTALETAIILIAFVVVASVFAFTILSAGTSSTEKGEEAIYAGLEGVQSTMSMKGAVMATKATASTEVDFVSFTVALASGGDPVDLTMPLDGGAPADPAVSLWGDSADGIPDANSPHKVVVSYRDSDNIESDVSWIVEFVGNNNDDDLLDEGELAKITVWTKGLGIAANDEFTIEVKPPTGAVLNINRTIPAALANVMELR